MAAWWRGTHSLNACKPTKSENTRKSLKNTFFSLNSRNYFIESLRKIWLLISTDWSSVRSSHMLHWFKFQIWLSDDRFISKHCAVYKVYIFSHAFISLPKGVRLSQSKHTHTRYFFLILFHFLFVNRFLLTLSSSFVFTRVLSLIFFFVWHWSENLLSMYVCIVRTTLTLSHTFVCFFVCTYNVLRPHS